MEYPESGPSRLPTTPRSDQSNAHPSSADKGKRKADGQYRPKNLQACDRCRTKKTKCEPLDTRRDLCQACNTASLTCTFDLPLTASRTKRIRNGLYQSHGAVWSVDDNAGSPRGAEHVDEGRMFLDRAESEIRHSTPVVVPRARSVLGLTPLRTTSTRREGPTAISYILHSTPTLPISYLSEYDELNNLSMVVHPPESGNGYMRIIIPNRPPPDSSDPPSHVLEALRSPSWTEVVNRLVETFLVHVSPLMPIVTREDMPEVTQTLCHAMAAVAAARRNCPKEIFDCLNYIVTQEMHEQDTMSDPSRQSVQTLLVTCLVDELALQNGAASSESVSRTRLSGAIRLAQDLSMDQADLGDPDGETDRRIWQCAVILDQWNAARTGVRPIIPSSSLPSGLSDLFQRGENVFFHHLFTLTLILSDLLAKVYGINGINKTRNQDIQDIRVRLLRWKEELPPILTFNGAWSSLPAGILHLLHTTVTFLLYRPFMRWSFICPSHIDLSLDIPVWLDLNPATRVALEWATNQDELGDLLFFGPYALGLMGLVQYHSYARRREWDGVVILEKFRETTTRWIEGWGEGRMPLQTSQLQVISLLYSCAQKAAQEGFTSYDLDTFRRGLNPIPGVLNRLPETVVHGVTFLRDPTHPKGGVLVATQKAAMEIKDLPPDTVIIGGHPSTAQLPDLSAILGSAPPSNTINVAAPTAQTGIGFSADGTNPNSNAADGRITMSTPDWDAIVSSLNYPLGNNPDAN
uniref:Zn(2)-C6 fungal-type domain-containing protein n=1 Tax=Kwoniella bestiolae CBS 10118 TaxID=1296100 RepID=A0A1B9G7X0_9TREE|nr:hypothetical protein I302_01953 [Kwoniella bestiolae CBS 10118]OCF27118.1 hypothetical protein I302_01953 [Kwoniella bestiolae CBS 10118]